MAADASWPCCSGTVGKRTTSGSNASGDENGRKRPRNSPNGAACVRLNDGSCVRLRPQHLGHVWSYDFVADYIRDGYPLRMLTVIDEFPWGCLTIRAGGRLASEDVQECLTALSCSRGVPENIRSDNGPELTCRRVRRRLGELGARTLFVHPGRPCGPAQDAVRGTGTPRASIASATRAAETGDLPHAGGCPGAHRAGETDARPQVPAHHPATGRRHQRRTWCPARDPHSPQRQPLHRHTTWYREWGRFRTGP